MFLWKMLRKSWRNCNEIESLLVACRLQKKMLLNFRLIRSCRKLFRPRQTPINALKNNVYFFLCKKRSVRNRRTGSSYSFRQR